MNLSVTWTNRRTVIFLALVVLLHASVWYEAFSKLIASMLWAFILMTVGIVLVKVARAVRQGVSTLRADRGQVNLSIGVFVFFATLAGSALVFILLEQAHDPIMTIANTSSYANNSSRLTTGIDRADLLWDNWAFFVLALSAVLGIVAAAFSSRRP